MSMPLFETRASRYRNATHTLSMMGWFVVNLTSAVSDDVLCYERGIWRIALIDRGSPLVFIAKHKRPWGTYNGQPSRPLPNYVTDAAAVLRSHAEKLETNR